MVDAVMNISNKSIEAIIGFEVTSEEYYNRNYLHPTWPGGDSGVTVGVGYDLGMNRRETIIMDWTANVNLNTVALLADQAGITGQAARLRIIGLLKQVIVPYSSALHVFTNNTLPRFYRAAIQVYPGLDLLNADTQGAIVSLVYNRGNKLTGDTRTEMKELVPLIACADYTGIADAIARMKRLWIGEGLDGLIARREAEANLVLQSIMEV